MTIDRNRLLEVLAAVLAEHPRLPMEQVAQAVGVSRATLHRLFPSRDAVVCAVLEYALEVAMQAIERADLERGPADQALARLVAESVPQGSLHLFLATDRGERCGASAAADERWEPHRQRLLAMFRRGQEEGVFRVDLPARWMLDATGALLVASAESVRAGRLALASVTESVLGVLLDGTRRRSG